MDLENFFENIPFQDINDIKKNINTLITIDDEKTYILHYACKNNCLEAVNWCLENGADPLQVDNDGFIPIVYTTDLEIMINLFNKGDLSYYEVPPQLSKPLDSILEDDDEEYTDDDEGSYTEGNDDEGSYTEGNDDEGSYTEGDEDEGEFEFDFGENEEGDDDEGSYTEGESEEEILLNMPADNKTSLFLEACRYGNGELINFLLSNTKVDLYFTDYFKLTGIHYLCDKYENFPILINILENYEFDLRTESVMGETILFEIIKTLCYREKDGLSIDFEILDYLMSKPFDLNKVNILDESILYTALLLEGFKTFTYLLNHHQININSVDGERMNILMRAIIADCDENYINAILNHPELNINYQNAFGDTALSISADLEMEKIMKILVSAGSDTTITNNEDKNLYEDYMRKKKYGI